jgi:hypothetical protein
MNARDIKYSEFWRTADSVLIREDYELKTVETGERSFETSMMLRFLSPGRSQTPQAEEISGQTDLRKEKCNITLRGQSSLAKGEAITTQRLTKLVLVALDISGSANLILRPYVTMFLNSVNASHDEVNKIVVIA